MSIQELTKKVKQASKNRTHEERIDLLKKAHIIDNDGFYSSSFFSEETVRKDKQTAK